MAAKSSLNGQVVEDVLTLTEAAVFLKVPEKLLHTDADAGKIPGRKIGEEWRFSKTALQSWLAKPEDVRSDKEIFLSLAGAWPDDEETRKMTKFLAKSRRPRAKSS
jgi:excisionase family DNA binding protein